MELLQLYRAYLLKCLLRHRLLLLAYGKDAYFIKWYLIKNGIFIKQHLITSFFQEILHLLVELCARRAPFSIILSSTFSAHSEAEHREIVVGFGAFAVLFYFGL